MYIMANGKKYACGRPYFGAYLRWPGVVGLETPVAGSIVTYRNDGFVMREDDVSDWLRQVYENGALVLTNEPEPVPMPEPVPDVEAVKATRIAQSKSQLEAYLLANPLLWYDGKYYAITAEKQNQLTSKILSATIAQQTGTAYNLTWNDTGEVCAPWTLEDLVKLAFAIDARVTGLVTYQQQKEVEIRNCQTLEDVEAVVVDYGSVAWQLPEIDSGTEAPEDGGEGETAGEEAPPAEDVPPTGEETKPEGETGGGTDGTTEDGEDSGDTTGETESTEQGEEDATADETDGTVTEGADETEEPVE